MWFAMHGGSNRYKKRAWPRSASAIWKFEIASVDGADAVAMSDLHHCLDIWSCPLEALKLPEADARKFFSSITKSSAPGGFREGELSGKAPLSFGEEALVVAVLFAVMGCPLMLLPSLFFCLTFASWAICLVWLLAVLFLALHPTPRSTLGKQSEFEHSLARSYFTLSLYRYFSYRFVWSGDAKEKCEKCAAWIGGGKGARGGRRDARAGTGSESPAAAEPLRLTAAARRDDPQAAGPTRGRPLPFAFINARQPEVHQQFPVALAA